MDGSAAVTLFDLGHTLRSHGTVLTFLFLVSLALLFLLGYALRDAVQKRGQRLRAPKAPERALRRP